MYGFAVVMCLGQGIGPCSELRVVTNDCVEMLARVVQEAPREAVVTELTCKQLDIPKAVNPKKKTQKPRLST